MRVYGRTYDSQGNPTWVEVQTDASGFNDAVYLTALAQCLKLNLGESPFYANYGIPAHQSVITQVFPDYYVMATQTQYAPYFASLSVTRQPGSDPPQYNVNAVTHSGAILSSAIPT